MEVCVTEEYGGFGYSAGFVDNKNNIEYQLRNRAVFTRSLVMSQHRVKTCLDASLLLNGNIHPLKIHRLCSLP